MVVDAIDDGCIGILAGCRNKNTFRAGGKMRRTFFAVIEPAGTFEDDIDTMPGMRDHRRVAFMCHGDPPGADIHPTVTMADRRMGAAMYGVEFIEMGRCLDRARGVDQNNLDIFPLCLHKGAKNHAPNAAKAADCESNCQYPALLSVVFVPVP